MAFETSNQKLDELENSGLLDDAIANATERRYHCVEQGDYLPELLSEEANSVVGGQVVRPPITCGIIACEPEYI
jgi:hypothetical protein